MNIRMTDAQHQEAKTLWDDRGEFGGATFGQVRFGATASDSEFRVDVFSPREADRINALLVDIRRLRNERNKRVDTVAHTAYTTAHKEGLQT